MMDYSRYIVDPWRGAKEAQAINMQNEQNAFARQQAQKRNALAEREFQASERQNALTNQYRNRQLGMIEQEKGMQLLSVQADVLGRALDSVTDEQSYQQFKNFMSQLGPMADTKLMRFITSQAPANYDPQVVERGKQFLSTLRQKPESGLTGTAKNLEVILGRKPTIQELQDFAKASKSETKVSVDVGTKSMTELGKEMSKALVTERENAMGAIKGYESLQEAKSLLDSGMITGAGAEYLTSFGNLLATRLGFSEYEDPVANTQAFAATMGNQVGQIIKQFGSGTGLSDADRDYAEKIVGGKITLSEKAIRRLLAINEKAYRNVINNYNRKARQAMGKPGAEQLPYDLIIDYDFSKKPAQRINTNVEIQQGAPSVGTIDSGYRFKGGNPADPNNWEKVQ